MADTEKKVEIDESLLKELLKNQEESKRKIAELEAANMVNSVIEGKKDIRELENLEERFKVKEYRLRNVSIIDDAGKQKGGIVVGWTARGAYDVWDKSGPNAEKVVMMDVFFAGREKDKPTTISASQYANAGRIACKEVSKDVKLIKHKTGEEVEVMEWPKPGRGERGNNMTSTGVIIDGYYSTPEGTITLQVPGYDDPITMDLKYF